MQNDIKKIPACRIYLKAGVSPITFKKYCDGKPIINKAAVKIKTAIIEVMREERELNEALKQSLSEGLSN
jgi:hypothetical protein